MDEYFKCILSGNFAVKDSEKIDKDGQEEEFIMLSLRTAKGLNLALFKEKFGVDFKEKYSSAFAKVGGKSYIIYAGRSRNTEADIVSSIPIIKVMATFKTLFAEV